MVSVIAIPTVATAIKNVINPRATVMSLSSWSSVLLQSLGAPQNMDPMIITNNRQTMPEMIQAPLLAKKRLTAGAMTGAGTFIAGTSLLDYRLWHFHPCRRSLVHLGQPRALMTSSHKCHVYGYQAIGSLVLR